MFKSWWSAKRSKQKMLTKTQKNKKGPLSHRKIKCSFLDNIQLLMIDQAIWAKNVDQNTKKREIEIGLNMNTIGKKSFQERSSSTFYQSTPPSIIIIWFYAWTGNWWISISNGYMDSNPTHQPSPAKKIKCSFLDYVQLLVIGWVGQWTRTPSTTPLQPKK